VCISPSAPSRSPPVVWHLPRSGARGDPTPQFTRIQQVPPGKTASLAPRATARHAAWYCTRKIFSRPRASTRRHLSRLARRGFKPRRGPLRRTREGLLGEHLPGTHDRRPASARTRAAWFSRVVSSSLSRPCSSSVARPAGKVGSRKVVFGVGPPDQPRPGADLAGRRPRTWPLRWPRTVFDRYNIVEDEDVKDAVAQLEAGAAAELGRVLDTGGGAATTNDEAPPA